MQPIQKVIVPVDFNQHTDDLTEFAIGVANKLEAKVIFFHVASVAEHALGDLDYSLKAIELLNEEIIVHAGKKMAALVEKSKTECPGCEGVVLNGDVPEDIVLYAMEHNNDLMIMGTHGAQGIEKILLGSVTEQVLRRASCPILIFNPYKGLAFEPDYPVVR